VAFDQVFEAAGILAEERDRVTKTRPAPPSRLARPGRQETDSRASLEAFGVPIDRIIEMGALAAAAAEVGHDEPGRHSTPGCGS
jgi:hypothetical protein